MVYLSPQTALILVDLQNDFCPGGALAVPQGNDVIPVLNQCLHLFQTANGPIIATRDWHPANHCSFIDQGGTWPAHCIQDTPGADFPQSLKLPQQTLVISKGTDPGREEYSGFANPNLNKHLRLLGVTTVVVGGLATDYCVKETVKEALQHGLTTVLLWDGCRAVEASPGDGARAIEAMRSAGAVLAELRDLKL